LALILGAATAALGLLGAAGPVLAFPFVGAAACPSCYGLERFAGSAFIERAVSPQQRAHAAAVPREARERVRTFTAASTRGPGS
jgi:hypothetical protein